LAHYFTILAFTFVTEVREEEDRLTLVEEVTNLKDRIIVTWTINAIIITYAYLCALWLESAEDVSVVVFAKEALSCWC
jgi:hypothetical protein